ncbi:MAG: exonuclease SbcCD subunit D [Acidaminococcaceae bacterium]
MRFLHTSDWHLGRIFHGLHMTENQASVLKELIALAVDQQVDAVLIAGDIYDRAVPPTPAVELLDWTLAQLVQKHHIPVILIAGNHDNPERLGFGQSLFAEKQLFIYGPVTKNAAPVLLYDAFGPVYFAPLTYCEPLVAAEISGLPIKTHEEALHWQVEQMLRQITPTARKVALAHVFLSGAQESPDSERPLALGGSTTVAINNFAAFNYTALGHLHACQKSDNKTRYSGSLLKYSFNEVNQHKGVHIVDLDQDGNVTTKTLTLTSPHELACLRGNFADLLAHPRPELIQHYLQITLDDAQPILDAKYRLEQCYPHILHLEYARLLKNNTEPSDITQRKQLGVKELFVSFFTQINDRPLTTAEEELLNTTINAAQQTERRS